MMAAPFQTFRRRFVNAVRSLGGYEAASPRLGGGSWIGAPSPNNAALNASPTVRARARHQARNNPLIENALRHRVAAETGAGIVATPQHSDPETRKRIIRALESWSRRADADGLTDWPGLQALAEWDRLVDGEALFVWAGDQLRRLPAEQLDESFTRPLEGGAYAVAGVVFNADGTRRGYRIFRERPGDPFNARTETVEIDAADVLHVFDPVGAGQVRGLSPLASVIVPARDLDELTNGLLVQQKTAAMFYGVLIDQNDMGGERDPLEELNAGITPGALLRLPGGYDLKTATPAAASGGVDFAKMMLRQIAAGVGVPAHLLSGDVSDANYSSLRAAMMAFKLRVEQTQFNIIVPQLCRPVFDRVVLNMALAGELPGYFDDPEPFHAVEFIPPAIPGVDPQKDAAADAEELRLGLTSRRQLVAKRGYSVEDLDAEIAADRERQKALGLTFGESSNAA